MKPLVANMYDNLGFKLVRVCLILLALVVLLFVGRIAYDIYQPGAFEDMKRRINTAPNEPIR